MKLLQQVAREEAQSRILGCAYPKKKQQTKGKKLISLKIKISSKKIICQIFD